MRNNNSLIHTLRYILVCVGVLFLVQTTDVGSSGFFITCASILGLYLSNVFLRKNVSLLTICLIHLAIYIVSKGIYFIIQNGFIQTSSPFMDLHPDILYTQFLFLFSVYVIVFLENQFFWRKSWILSVEVFAIGVLLITLLSGHRFYKVDIPNTISSLTWKLPILQSYGIEPQELLVSIAFIFGLFSLLYVYLAHSRNLLNDNTHVYENRKRRVGFELTCALIAIAAMFFLSKQVLHSFESQLSQIMNGVGPSSNLQNGQSNLGFNKASNPSRQAAAFVRLQNSFDENPWKPMLYLREGALSTFNGKEIVKSGNEYDTDAPTLRPGEPYRSELLDGEYNREKLLQAVYVLSDKVTPFGIDAPIQFTPIKNPNPKRFRYAYSALSMALVDPLETLVDLDVGSSLWTKENWEHYLRAPASNDLLEANVVLPKPDQKDPSFATTSGEDLRYKALSDQIVQGETNPIKKAALIIDYLSKESIYVLEPGHTLGSNGDPVAPYLFAEKKRGYCVHYAHAATYLLRLAGIPARIGTGFLVDLQYAKGGDILVQMGDRHAWPEVYVQGRGWIVFDVTPAQAENKEVPVPDEGLLEELMSEVDPIEELTEQIPELEKDKDSLSPVEALLGSPIWAYLKYLLPLILILFTLAKLFIRYAWRFVRNPRRKIRLAYLSALSQYEDVGLQRHFGETRVDYAERLFNTKNIDIRDLTNRSISQSLSSHEVIDSHSIQIPKAFFKNKVITILVHILSFINPISLHFIKKAFKKGSFILVIGLSVLASEKHTYAIPGNEDLDQQIDFSFDSSEVPDSQKSSDTLLIEAIGLMREGKSIDARAKLEYALNKNPNDHRPYLFLGQYYLSDVGHFKLAYRYLKQARKLFEKNNPIYGSDEYDLGFQNQHALILYLESEAALNLDFYQESLDILSEYEKHYKSEWFAGQKAWVLMKLKRNAEAIEVAKIGLSEGADPKRTWNILGILLSLNNERELSLQAFQKAIKYELTLGGIPQVATPLNNSGEVYRELFRDAFAESAWLKALTLTDGCEHILPSVNLSILFTDQLRLFQAEQVLSDFQACYAQKPERKDSEHRTILALARAKLKLLSNQIDEAEQLARVAADDQQWFGKIGTNENDVKFSAWITLAQIEKMKAEKLKDSATSSIKESALNLIESYRASYNSWWLNRKAKIYAVNELVDFEDLFIRHTDTMLAYPLLGSLVENFDYTSLKKRLDRLRVEDVREGAKNYYDYFEARKLASIGETVKAREIIDHVLERLPEHERLLKVEALSTKVLSYLDDTFFFNRSKVIKEHATDIESIYQLNPSRLRYYGIALPVSVEVDPRLESAYKKIKDNLLKYRFLNNGEGKSQFKLTVTQGDAGNAFIQLYNTVSNRRVVGVEIKGKDQVAEKINEFITLAFSHTSDPKGMTLPEINFYK